MAVKLYLEPTPAPGKAPREELKFDGPTLEEWTRAGYIADRYPGEQAFMRRRAPQHHEAEAITDERQPTPIAQDHDEPAHAITDDEHVTVGE